MSIKHNISPSIIDISYDTGENKILVWEIGDSSDAFKQIDSFDIIE